ncbi:MAG: MATE family efflux transporter [Oscillospiraceae bacterium]|nr:MATE family efflux transporter [Oscillospiraceae bacterium]
MKKHTVDMTKGNIFKLIIAFAIPIMISGVLQTLYNAADMIVVGQFAGEKSLAAVGSTGSAINLIIGIFVGLSSATNVIVARKFGAGNKTGVSKAVHTAIAVCLAGGVLLAISGFFLSKKILIWMSSPEDVIGLSALYMKIYFMGVPAMLIYNFGSAILRAVGDSARPTKYLMLSGIVNVLLNLLFVICFKMDVAGVATATVISQAISALLVVRCLIRTDDCFKLVIRKIKIYSEELKEIILLGIPAGIQGALFSISNIIIQSSINACGSEVMAGNSAASSVEGIVYIAMNSFFHATLTFIGQNYGAHDFKRMRRGFWTALGTSAVFGVVLSVVFSTFSEFFLQFFTNKPNVISYGADRMRYVCALYFLCGLMEVGTGALRGMGVAFRSMFTCLIGACGIRLIMTIIGAPYRTAEDLHFLFVSYPISWAVTAIAQGTSFFIISKSREKKWLNQKKATERVA